VGDFNGDGLADVLSVVPGSQPEPQRGDATVAVADTALTGAASPLPDPAVRSLLASSHVGGVDGVYLKAVRGPVLAADDAQVVFDPASAIKAALLLHGLLEVANVNPATGATYRRLSDAVAVTDDQTQGGCPIYAGNFHYQTLDGTFWNMMRASDNRDTDALRRLFGSGNLQRTIEVLGMGATRWEAVIGCGRNQATLQDLGRLYEAVGRGLLEGQEADFLRLPNNTPIFEMDPIIDGRAAQVGLPATFRDAYRAHVVNVYTGGSGTDSVEKRTVAGLMSLPICTPTGIIQQEYVYGVFVDGASAISPDPSGSGEFNLNRVVAEVLRREIWRSVDSFAPGGCVP
jgi:hypothetical protein